MADPFIGEIKMVGFTFAPRNWAECNGTQMKIEEQAALYSLLGVQFGGDGRTYFNLPDLRSRVPVHPGGDISQGLQGGAEIVTLNASELTKHTHQFMGTTSDGATSKPSGKVYATAKWHTTQTKAKVYYGDSNMTQLNPGTCTSAGGSQPHENRQPSLVVLFTIALAGEYPSRN